jgi:hypothetical protein
MASFIGSTSEFKRFIGPRLRNLVQQLTKKHKLQVGKCQHCGTQGSLETAHIKGNGRGQIIDEILAHHTQRENVTVDLEVFEQNFKDAHNPLEDSVLILCSKCHAEYDNELKLLNTNEVVGVDQFGPPINGSLLPITLEPGDPLVFKSALLLYRRAIITTHFNDGREERRVWNASRFSQSSDILNNLRSRPEFRQGTWQGNNIARVHVSIAN